jgi:sigma-B regulation protein RsbU (phosphoserine phosphatase)
MNNDNDHLEDLSALSGELLVSEQDLFVLDYISHLLTQSAFDLDTVLYTIVKTTAERVRVKASALRLLEPGTDRLVMKAVYGLSKRFLAEAPSYDTESRFQRLIEAGGVFQIYNVEQEPDYPFAQSALAEGIRGLLAVGLYQDEKIIGALSVYTEAPNTFSPSDIRILRVIANQAAVAIQLAQFHKAQMEKEWLDRELALAAEIQQGILPEAMPDLPGYQIAARAQPWEQVSGDFYDFINLPAQNLGIAIGDVSGKGIPAALLMFTVRMALRAHVEHEYAVSEIMRRVNRALHRDTGAEQFATLFYGVLNRPQRIFTYVNASQNPPLLFRGDQVISLEIGGLPVGVLADATFEMDFVVLQPGDLLVLYTDGYTEITGSESEMFGEERLIALVREHRDRDPEAIIRVLEGAVTAYMGASIHGDDRTIVVLKVV